ncbi:hypothetical protein Cni_G06136 [Canna indica]|uniref:Uncharacterized protein n=1 Tax=Canna indica TaxID=4628 RepID=A0AAQ3JWH8_9LILI|nr:hypothetical protein Cni_G06136 [Canna indica]
MNQSQQPPQQKRQVSPNAQSQFSLPVSANAQFLFGTVPPGSTNANAQLVVGLCWDMRPESEREERERKGDLNRYERLDGDRNQTSKYLAVKKVEPAELAHDLSKMTPEIRSSPEILFARDVARTQALASLHSSLLKNKGMPVTNVISWLGLEEEDVRSLLEYHGFVLKKFEETYMVKKLKKSQLIFNDVYSGPTIFDVTKKRKTASDGDTEFPMEHSQPVLHKKAKNNETVSQGLDTVDQIALASEADTWRTASKDVGHNDKANTIIGAITQPRMFLDEQTLPFLNSETEAQAAELFLPCGTILDHAVCNCVQQNEDYQMVESEEVACMDQEVLLNPEGNIVRDVEPISSSFNKSIHSSVSYMDLDRELENKDQSLVPYGSSQIADEKLKLILRKWKKQATKRRESREQRQARSSLLKCKMDSLSLLLEKCSRLQDKIDEKLAFYF